MSITIGKPGKQSIRVFINRAKPMHREGMAHAAGKAADDQITPNYLTQARPATFIAHAEDYARSALEYQHKG
jgi:hypothetical protein